jgi:uncharacterized protein YndB with AHSA1/START domain
MSTRNDSAILAGYRLQVSRVINAPCGLVYRAWTEPKQMVQWFSPEDVKCHSVEAEVKVGGAYRIHMIASKGDCIAVGNYREIVPDKRLQFTWNREDGGVTDTLVTVEFEDLGKSTRLTLTHEGFENEEDRDDHNEGWSSAVEKFGGMMEQHKIKE